jgi:hypothetical protein
LDAVAILDEIIPTTKFLAAINGSAAVKAALDTPGPKTLLCPSDAAVGTTSLADDGILLGHIFNGNLTAESLQTVSKIVAYNGETYDVTSSTVGRHGRGRRAVVLIRISNSKSAAFLTALEVPAEGGSALSINGVLLPALATSDNDNNSSDKSAATDWSSPVLWTIFACGALLILLTVAIVIAVRKSRRVARAASPDDTRRWSQIDNPDGFAVVDNALRDLKHAQGAIPRHYSVGYGAAPGKPATASTHDHPPPSPSHHFYPGMTGSDWGAVPKGSLSAELAARRKSSGGTLNTPQHPSTLDFSHQRRSQEMWPTYLDPVSDDFS